MQTNFSRHARIALDASRHGESSIIVLDEGATIEAGLDDVSPEALQSLITISAEPDHVALVPVAADDTDGRPLMVMAALRRQSEPTWIDTGPLIKGMPP